MQRVSDEYDSSPVAAIFSCCRCGVDVQRPTSLVIDIVFSVHGY